MTSGLGRATEREVGTPCVDAPFSPDAQVADAMIHRPKLCGADATVADARTMFADDHVHALVVVENGTLLAVVEREDLLELPQNMQIRVMGLRGRTVAPHAALADVWEQMTASGRRRLAVIDEHHKLLGLLCLKRSGRGFCGDDDVEARAVERQANGA